MTLIDSYSVAQKLWVTFRQSNLKYALRGEGPLLDQPDRPCENVIQRWTLHLRDSQVRLWRYRLKVRT
jgi:hypothetical protein